MAMRPARSAQRDCAQRLHARKHLVQLQKRLGKGPRATAPDCAELAVANRRLANAALTDLLTGLPTPRGDGSARSRPGVPLRALASPSP